MGWTDQDQAAALGVVPVGATKMTWGGNADGSSDWFDAKVKELGAEAPARYDDTDGIPFDEIAKTSPDLILATNSGVTKEDYAKLTKIAPVVAYPGSPWVTPWRTSLETVGKALGRSERGREGREADRGGDRRGQGGVPRPGREVADLRLPVDDRPLARSASTARRTRGSPFCVTSAWRTPRP